MCNCCLTNSRIKTLFHPNDSFHSLFCSNDYAFRFNVVLFCFFWISGCKFTKIYNFFPIRSNKMVKSKMIQKLKS